MSRTLTLVLARKTLLAWFLSACISLAAQPDDLTDTVTLVIVPGTARDLVVTVVNSGNEPYPLDLFEKRPMMLQFELWNYERGAMVWHVSSRSIPDGFFIPEAVVLEPGQKEVFHFKIDDLVSISPLKSADAEALLFLNAVGVESISVRACLPLGP
ncbi:MAG TPA: hypothetical protein VGE29_13845, partial [Prosthecobacter sp.]